MKIWENNNSLFNDYLTLLKGDYDYKSINKFDQIHACGLSATKKLTELGDIKENCKVLEIGGAIGGTARYLSGIYGAYSLNLDLSFSYSLTGYKLTQISDVNNIDFVNANALFLPIKDSSFEIILMQHINMNINDKNKLLSECQRVLKEKGKILFHEWFLENVAGLDEINKKIPLPWADNEQENCLCSFPKFKNTLINNGFEISNLENETEKALGFYEKLIENKAFNNPIFKNRKSQLLFSNVVDLIKERKLVLLLGKADLTSKH